jgi:hypothetical protein
MRKLLFALLLPLPLVAGCAGGDDDGPNPFDDEYPLSGEDEVKGDGYQNAPDDSKADEAFPAKFDMLTADQSPVKSQGSRGVCSIFATLGQVENLYIAAGQRTPPPDFSEQYLQWSVKNEVGDFRNTEGSSGDSNLEAVVEYGVVEEAAWPYESFKWGPSNDPACNGGENLPTKCYTNGEPPQAARDARKWKLPSKRWISSTERSIKHHLMNKKTTVVAGMTFFYQSWNHRLSTLPVSTDLWRKGAVTYPNAEDKTKSLEKRAGHAIVILGWDDNLEFDMRDKDGNPVLDAQGNVRKEKGFWLFKNSWGTGSFGVDHPAGAGYGWLSYKYVSEYASTVMAEVPRLEMQTETVCDNNRDDDGDNQEDCADPDCAANPACTGGGTVRTYSATPGAAIPDNDPAGVSSTIAVPDTGALASVKVTLAITHTYRGDLKVTLTKGSTTVTVVDEEGGSADNINASFDLSGFSGDIAGDWVLKVVDGAGQDEGTLDSWELEVGVQ